MSTQVAHWVTAIHDMVPLVLAPVPPTEHNAWPELNALFGVHLYIRHEFHGNHWQCKLDSRGHFPLSHGKGNHRMCRLDSVVRGEPLEQNHGLPNATDTDQWFIECRWFTAHRECRHCAIWTGREGILLDRRQ